MRCHAATTPQLQGNRTQAGAQHQQQVTQVPAIARQQGRHAASISLAAALGSALLAAAPALAVEGVKYDPAVGGDFVKNLAGVGYLGLVLFFIVRLLRKRARTATGEVRLALLLHACTCMPGNLLALAHSRGAPKSLHMRCSHSGWRRSRPRQSSKGAC